MNERPARAWHVFVTYVAAVAGIFATTGIAIEALRAMYPDVPEATLVRTLPGLLAGSLAASAGLLITLVLFVHPLTPARLRLLPGWETGPTLAAMALGLIALNQTLDSLTVLVGLGERGAIVLVRRLLQGADGPGLFAAVVVFGLIAGTAEEIFFRGYMQSRLRGFCRPAAAVATTSAAFAVLHIEFSAVYVVLVFVLGLYLGFVVEVSGSALPAIACHVVNNVLYTLQTALGIAVVGRAANVVAAAIAAVVFLACVLWIRRAAATSPPP